MQPPAVSCAPPDALWHATNVSLACIASDSLSGLANNSPANFNLTTSVPANTETAYAQTNSHTTYDAVGNSTTVGPIYKIKVDMKPPSIVITQPTATAYPNSSTLTLYYTVTDGGSGVATVAPTMNGSSKVGGSTITNGLAINLLTALPLGSNTFTINAADNVGNKSSSSVTFTIIVTPESIIQAVDQFYASGAIRSSGTATVLTLPLNRALAARNSGQCSSSDYFYGLFIGDVRQLTGSQITPAAAAILIADAQYLETHCP
jgi:hypothetical protein